ncbi:MAG: proline iminopeptidase-family hydrolase [Bacteroidota bacterium]
MKTFSFLSLLLLSAAMIYVSGCNSDTESFIKEGSIEAEGGEIRYRIVGADKPATPLLVVHGGPGANHQYLITLESLAIDRPVIFYDQLGCGNSDPLNDTSLMTPDRYARELKQLMETLGYDGYFLLGQSWGGALAAHYLLEFDQGLAKAAVFSAPLLSTPLWEADQQVWLAQLPQQDQDAIREADSTGDYSAQPYLDAMDAYYARHLCRIDPWPDFLLESFGNLNAAIYNHMWGYSEFTVCGTLKNFDLTPRLPEIEIPVLFTCGEFDEARPETCGYFAGLIPDAELFVMEGCSHVHHVEDQTVYNARISEFLNHVH